MRTKNRSFFQNINMIITGIADALGATTSTVTEIAQSAEELAKAGKTLAVSKRKIVELQCKGEEAELLQELEEEYPDLNIDWEATLKGNEVEETKKVKQCV